MPDQSPRPPFDLAIIGGGVNGCGIARDAVGRGLKVVLAERDDLASGTSQWSTKLIHGGLRYLEHYAFRLVREALQEREVLWRAAPHIVSPLRFVLPHDAGQRPAWMLRAGLFLYDHIGGRKLLPATTTVDLTRSPLGAPLAEHLKRGFEYSDCWVDDARLVVLNAIAAAEAGADIRVRTAVTSARVEGDQWRIAMRAADGTESVVRARALVVAAGPWVGRVVEGVVGANTSAPLRLVKGSHLVVRKLYDHDRAYIFQNPDGRIVFAIPYEGDFTLIGTTDEPFFGDPADVAISDSEIDYLLAAVSRNLKERVTRADIVRTYAGVRPLYDDGASAAKDATRDYVLDLDAGAGRPPRLTIYGGKITTYRRLAEHALDMLRRHVGGSGGWTATAHLPGGDFPVDGVEALVTEFAVGRPGFPRAEIARLVRLYGTRAADILEGAKGSADLGERFGRLISEAELEHLVANEWARTAEDVLWRRTKAGLHTSIPDQERLRRRIGA